MNFQLRAVAAIALLSAIPVGCSKAPDNAAEAPVGANGSAGEKPGFVAPPTPAVLLPTQPPGDDPATFVPLNSQAVKDAIHSALRTGATQRWHDGKLSGYAVPSTTTGANGCRAVRYTVDQRPNGGYESITACDAS